MNERIEAYLTTHPSNRTRFEQLYELIDRVNQCRNANLTITALGAVAVISHAKNPKVNVAFFAYNNIDHPTLLIRGNRTYSFEPSDIKDISVEQLPDSAGERYTYIWLKVMRSIPCNLTFLEMPQSINPTIAEILPFSVCANCESFDV